MKWLRRRVKAYQEVEYEPMTVLDLLTEMKDVSELMTDLAYSALILDSDPIGAEVEELARRMDWLKYHLRLTASLAVRTPEEAEQVAGILQVADASEHIANAAEQMVELLDANVELRPFLGRVFDEADDRIASLTIPEGSQAAGRSIGELGVRTNTGMRVIAVRRGAKKWVYVPRSDTLLEVGDTVILRGQAEGAVELKAFFHNQVGGL
ncbi:MAG: potassium channel family protein [Thermoplasmatota archaeon]